MYTVILKRLCYIPQMSQMMQMPGIQQMINSPEVDQMMGSLFSDQGAGARQPGSGQRAVVEGGATPQQGQGAPDLGSLFQSMMPLAQQVSSPPDCSLKGGREPKLGPL